MEFILFFILREDGVEVPSLVISIVVVPLCYMYMSFLAGTVLFLFIYLASVFGGFMVMLIKHRGTYQSETMVKNYLAHSVRSAVGRHVFGIQARSFLRSKRLRNTTILLCVCLYIQVICNIFNPANVFSALTLSLFILVTGNMIAQHGLTVESNFFAGIRTRPVPLWRLLCDKYLLGMVTGAAGFILCLPLCIWSDASVLTLVSFFLFVIGFGNILALWDAFNVVPLDLFGKTYGNSQGAHFRVSTLLYMLFIMAVGYLGIVLYPGWLSQVMLSLAGVAGIIWHKSFFRWLEGRFEKKKYKYMNQYMQI